MNLDASCWDKTKEICCNLDVWGILVTVILQVAFLANSCVQTNTIQDAPFFAFRLVIILHYRLISSMNLFCTAKNTLVITLQVFPLNNFIIIFLLKDLQVGGGSDRSCCCSCKRCRKGKTCQKEKWRREKWKERWWKNK